MEVRGVRSSCPRLAERDRVDGELALPEVPELRLADEDRPRGDRLAGQAIERCGAEGRDEAHAGEAIVRPFREDGGLRSGAQDPQRVVDDEEQVTAPALEQRREGGGGERVDHAARGENAYPTPRTVRK